MRQFIGVFFLFIAPLVTANPWERIQQPISGKANPIGGYSNGCIVGAEAIPLSGKGYRVIRAHKKRFYGHPHLIQFIQRLAINSQQAGLPQLLIGDMSMAAGGRFSSGHASHQIGLDVDIWLRFGPLNAQQALNPQATLMVNRTTRQVNEKVWTHQQETLIRLAAEDPYVNRLFVNPAIKVKLCQQAGNDKGWLRKVRPWHGHDSHIHIRLNCPDDAPYCEAQSAIPEGDGCGDELTSWFKETKGTKATPSKVPPVLPQQCQMILSSQG